MFAYHLHTTVSTMDRDAPPPCSCKLASSTRLLMLFSSMECGPASVFHSQIKRFIYSQQEHSESRKWKEIKSLQILLTCLSLLKSLHCFLNCFAESCIKNMKFKVIGNSTGLLYPGINCKNFFILGQAILPEMSITTAQGLGKVLSWPSCGWTMERHSKIVWNRVLDHWGSFISKSTHHREEDDMTCKVCYCHGPKPFQIMLSSEEEGPNTKPGGCGFCS